MALDNRRRFRKRTYRSGRPHIDNNKPPQKMLNERRLGHFKVDLRDALERSETVAEERVLALAQTVTAKASRQGITDAKNFVSEKQAEGMLGDRDRDAIYRLLDRYSTYR